MRVWVRVGTFLIYVEKTEKPICTFTFGDTRYLKSTRQIISGFRELLKYKGMENALGCLGILGCLADIRLSRASVI